MANSPTEGSNTEKKSKETNPYAYLNRQDFSSENFKIEIKNLPKIYGINEIRKLLNIKLKLNLTKIKTPKRNSSYVFVCFRSDEDRENAIKIIDGYEWKKKQLSAVKAKPSPDPLIKKRKECIERDENKKKIKLDELSQEEKLKASTIPFWNVPYEEQLSLKQTNMENVLKKLGNSLLHNNPQLRKWVNEQKTLYNGLPCKLYNIRYSPEIDGYRNKCSFTIGINEETNLPTVGFRIGSYVNGVTGVGPIETLSHIPGKMKEIVRKFEGFVRSYTDLEVYNFEVQTGHFRQLMIRTTADSQQVMVIVGIHPQDLTQEQLGKFKKDLIEFFTKGDNKGAGVTSLYYQSVTKKISGEEAASPEHLWGEPHICETLLGLKFKISPEAFFQINTKAAEILYKSIIETAEPIPETILDVCCGTGTIGLCFASKCTKLLGLEVVPQAILDARQNAKLNNIENCEFFVGKAEEILSSVCGNASGNILAIVDPPRAGLQQKAVHQLRKIEKIQKIVYVSCDPFAALKNFIDIGRPQSKTLHNEPFIPVAAVAVDMFPHTKHCELIICFERFDNVLKGNAI